MLVENLLTVKYTVSCHKHSPSAYTLSVVFVAIGFIFMAKEKNTSSLSELNLSMIAKRLTQILHFRDETGLWDLSSYLIKPVQRILKYPLLLEEIYKVIFFHVAFWDRFLDVGLLAILQKESKSNDILMQAAEFLIVHKNDSVLSY